MFLKYNPSNIKREKRILDVSLLNSSILHGEHYYSLNIMTNSQHNLNVGDSIVIERLINDKVINSGILKVESNNFSNNSFSLSYNKYHTLYVDDVMDNINNGVIRVKNLDNFYYDENEIINVKKINYFYKLYNVNDNGYVKEIDFNPENTNNYLGYDKVSYFGLVYKWSNVITEIPLKYIGSNYFSYDYKDVNGNSCYISINDNIKLMDLRFIDENTFYRNDIKFYELNEYININIPFSNTVLNDFNGENLLKQYFNQQKEKLYPSIIDYEKRCFIPCINNDGTTTFINKINYNLFFRDRIGSLEWATNDSKGWNQYTLLGDGTFKKGVNLTNGDLVEYLGFTNDDIVSQKNKIKKSFLRLSFYDSMDPFNQMLVYYTTLFMDSNELYTKYFKKMDVTASLSVSDKYDKYSSTEGFYLYLFPDGIDKNQERTIYMKAEFNHAGYGKTIPFIFPRENNTLIGFENENFPTSLITEDNNKLTKYYEYLYLPIVVKYDDNLNDYIYYFDVNLKKSNELTINLYEPKINPFL